MDLEQDLHCRVFVSPSSYQTGENHRYASNPQGVLYIPTHRMECKSIACHIQVRAAQCVLHYNSLSIARERDVQCIALDHLLSLIQAVESTVQSKDGGRAGQAAL